MQQRRGMLVGVVCGVLVLAGCSREPAQEPESAIGAQDLSELGKDLSQVAGGSAPSSRTVECLTADINSEKQELDKVLQQPRETVAAQIPASELVYWGRTKTYMPVGEARCEGEFDSATRAEVATRPFEVFNAVTHARQGASVTFQPTPKGDFEKTADYEARITREKADLDKALSGKQITNGDIEHVWMGLFGSPRIKDDRLREDQLYNPDTETLSLTIVPQAHYVDGSMPSSQSTTQRPFEIPVRIRLTPEQARKFFREYPMAHLLNLRPAVALQMHKGTLTVREVSFKDESPDKFKRLGFKLDNLQVNVELSRNFLPGV